MAAACTSESEWSCMMAQPTRHDERMVEIVAPFPGKQKDMRVEIENNKNGGKKIKEMHVPICVWIHIA